MENSAAGTAAAGRVTRGIWFDKVSFNVVIVFTVCVSVLPADSPVVELERSYASHAGPGISDIVIVNNFG